MGGYWLLYMADDNGERGQAHLHIPLERLLVRSHTINDCCPLSACFLSLFVGVTGNRRLELFIPSYRLLYLCRSSVSG